MLVTVIIDTTASKIHFYIQRESYLVSLVWELVVNSVDTAISWQSSVFIIKGIMPYYKID
jgi:hypothetical protein